MQSFTRFRRGSFSKQTWISNSKSLLQECFEKGASAWHISVILSISSGSMIAHDCLWYYQVLCVLCFSSLSKPPSRSPTNPSKSNQIHPNPSRLHELSRSSKELELEWLERHCLRVLPGAPDFANSTSSLFGALKETFDFQAAEDCAMRAICVWLWYVVMLWIQWWPWCHLSLDRVCYNMPAPESAYQDYILLCPFCQGRWHVLWLTWIGDLSIAPSSFRVASVQPQADSVRNQYEHFLSLWRSSCAMVADRSVGHGASVNETELLQEAGHGSQEFERTFCSECIYSYLPKELWINKNLH